MLDMNAYIQVADQIEAYFVGFSECKHGERPSRCGFCNAKPKNDPRRWGFQDYEVGSEMASAILIENQFNLDEFNAKRLAFVMKMARKDKQAKAELGYDGKLMLVDRRPLKFGGPDKTLNDQRAYGSRAELVKFKHDEKGELHKGYGHNEKTFNRTARRYALTEAHKLNDEPKGSFVPRQGIRGSNQKVAGFARRSTYSASDMKVSSPTVKRTVMGRVVLKLRGIK